MRKEVIIHIYIRTISLIKLGLMIIEKPGSDYRSSSPAASHDVLKAKVL